MIKWIFALLLSIGFAYADSCPSRNHIFLIHGIGGSEKTFGEMDHYLEKINPCYVATFFNYATGDSTQSTYNFSDSLDDFIEKTLMRNSFGPEDRISFIMHSQGGLIGSIWLIQARMSENPLYKKVDSFITLSTPFYGSKIARLGQQFLFAFPNVDNPVAPMGRIELNEMSYGSPTIHAIQSNFSAIFENTHIRFLAIGGVKNISSPEVGEGDTTVTVYSSNPNHYSNILKINGSDKVQNRLFVVPFTTVKATHIPTTLPGIAKIEKDCLEKVVCDHPSIDHIVNQLKNPKYRPALQNNGFKKYRLHVYVKGETDDIITARIVTPDGKFFKLNFDKINDQLRSTFFHNYAKHSVPGEMKVEFFINKKLVKSTKVTVQGGFSSFITLSL
ncbi:MAG: hypothetical protein V4598_05835 [Bdellovibrionota bacterium]